MLESKSNAASEDLEAIADRRPTGALTLCLIAVFIVIGIWIAFYLLAFLPRGFTQ